MPSETTAPPVLFDGTGATADSADTIGVSPGQSC
jgi:hypothetical protein